MRLYVHYFVTVFKKILNDKQLRTFYNNKLGEDKVKKLMNLVFKYKVFPLSMGIVSMFLAITVVVQNISIASF